MLLLKRLTVYHNISHDRQIVIHALQCTHDTQLICKCTYDLCMIDCNVFFEREKEYVTILIF